MIIFGILGVLQYYICKTYKGWLRYLMPGVLTLFICGTLLSYLITPTSSVIVDPGNLFAVPSIYSRPGLIILLSMALFNFAINAPLPTLIFFLMAFVIKQEKSFDEMVKVSTEVESMNVHDL